MSKYIFNIITLFGGLAMFLYGMRQMGNGLKESSSGALKRIMGKATGTPVTAFFVGLLMTAVIQSSTATIVITSGLVGAGIITLHQSIGVIIGANVGTTVTGQIIRLLDLNTSSSSWLNFFKPSTLAPLALIIGIILFMRAKGNKKIAQIILGFGILFSGLLNMTGAVSTLSEDGTIEKLFALLGENPFIGYLIGAGVAFLLQSSSATIGILQAFSISGQLEFCEIYAVLVGIYLGDCVTTAIVCNIGAKPEARRVGVVNILFNLSETVLILVGVNLAHSFGWLDGIWHSSVNSGAIANTNTVFNLSCALLMLPMLSVYEKLSRKLVRDKADTNTVKQLEGLNPVFFSTPALAFNSSYQLLLEMFRLARDDIKFAFGLVEDFNTDKFGELQKNEELVDEMADKGSNYLMELSGYISQPEHVEILNQYYTVIAEFERLSDHAVNIAEASQSIREADTTLSDGAKAEMQVVHELISRVLDVTDNAFRYCDAVSARHIEPLEEVVDDIVGALKQNHLERLREGKCSIMAGAEFLNMLSDIERISDICSNIGTATIARLKPELKHEIHDYITRLHEGRDESFNREYNAAHALYFDMLTKRKSTGEGMPEPDGQEAKA